MSDFCVLPGALQAQQEELDAAYRNMCQNISEIGGVIRQLGGMSSFGGPIAVLRRLQQKGSDQQVKLRQSMNVLGHVAELYIGTELKNLGDGVFQHQRKEARSVYPVYGEAVWTPAKMVSNAEALFGMNVVIR